MSSLKERIDERVRHWNVVVQRSIETESSVLLLGTRHEKPVVLKIIRNRGDEWRSGEVLDAFEGKMERSLATHIRPFCWPTR